MGKQRNSSSCSETLSETLAPDLFRSLSLFAVSQSKAMAPATRNAGKPFSAQKAKDNNNRVIQ